MRKRQQQQQQQQQQQHDVGHEGVITGCDDFSLRFPIANPQGVAHSPLQSTYTHGIYFNNYHLQHSVMS